MPFLPYSLQSTLHLPKVKVKVQVKAKVRALACLEEEAKVKAKVKAKVRTLQNVTFAVQGQQVEPLHCQLRRPQAFWWCLGLGLEPLSLASKGEGLY